MLTSAEIEIIFKRFKKANPNPTTELIYHTPFELLVAVILSAQATDVSVNKATEKLFKKANTPAKMSKLKLSELENFIRSIGLYKTKANNILKMAKILVTQYDSQVPN